MNVQPDANKEIGLFPGQILSKTEEDILLEIYKNPTVVKHLQIMAQVVLEELASLNSLEKDDTFLAKAHALVSGKLQILQVLLSIANIPVAQTSDSQESQQ